MITYNRYIRYKLFFLGDKLNFQIYFSQKVIIIRAHYLFEDVHLHIL